MTTFFVTATGTEIGKTFITRELVHALRVDQRPTKAIKPIISGWDDDQISTSDTGELLTALGVPQTASAIDSMSPWRFKAPLSPHLAAAQEQREISFDELMVVTEDFMAQECAHSFIEGVGGVMVPIQYDFTVLDWMEAAALPIILVTGSYLGTLSHTLTAVEVIKHRNLSISALLINASTEDTEPLLQTESTLRQLLPELTIFSLPYLTTPNSHFERSITEPIIRHLDGIAP